MTSRSEENAVTGFKIENPQRELGGRYRADLLLDGRTVGVVERGWSQGGKGEKTYVAKIGRFFIAEARTMADLRYDLRDPELIAECRAMEEGH